MPEDIKGGSVERGRKGHKGWLGGESVGWIWLTIGLCDNREIHIWKILKFIYNLIIAIIFNGI